MSERMIPLKIADMAVAACNEEIAKLQAENERLKADVERLNNNCDYLDQKLDEELEKSAMLCGQVERLGKAGDAVAICLCGGTTEDYNRRCALNWLAAKEGKQS